MSHDIPKSFGERREEELKDYFRRFGQHRFDEFEPTVEEIKSLHDLLRGPSLEKLQIEHHNISHQCEDNALELIKATGALYEKLDKFNTDLGRKLSIYQTAINIKQGL